MIITCAPHTPLCPGLVERAGHLPLKGGDQLPPLLSPISDVAKEAPEHAVGVISLLEGEMPGRAEGGAKGHRHSRTKGCPAPC